MHTQAAKKLGFDDQEGIVAFGAGAVNNTLLALMSQVSSNLSLVSRYADDIEKDGVTLHHRGDEYVVPAGDIKLPQTSVIKELGEKIASPRIVLNGRQLGGDYDEIFDSMGPATEFVVTAQNGPSARMLADAAQKYVERHPEKKAILENVVGPVAASFCVICASTPSGRRRDGVATARPPRVARGPDGPIASATREPRGPIAAEGELGDARVRDDARCAGGGFGTTASWGRTHHVCYVRLCVLRATRACKEGERRCGEAL